MNRSPREARALVLLFLAVTFGLAAGCGKDESPNQPPTVSLDTGFMEGDTVSYQIRLYWTGHDEDGFISRFEYAIDPPIAFTEEEIAGGGPGIVSELIPGTGSTPSVTRISKVVGGETISFDWVHADWTNKLFTFSATESGSGDDVSRGRFFGMHAFYVRAVDNQGAFSRPEKTAFTSATLAPMSWFTRPRTEGGYYALSVRTPVRMEWAGQDPDDVDGPVDFLYAIVPLGTRDPPIPIMEAEMATTESYVFGVRAVDAAGPVEPFIDWGRNAFRATVYPSLGGYPTLTINEATTGSFSFRGKAAARETEVAVGNELYFTWQGSAEQYGGTIWGYSYGADIVDLDDESAWSGWGANLKRNKEPLVFHSTGIHTFHVRVRDTAGATTLGAVIFKVIDFTFDKEILFVDDSYDSVFPRDWEHDAFWRARIEGYGQFQPEQIGEFHAFGTDDFEFLFPRVPTLEELGRFKMIVWENLGAGFGAATSLNTATAGRPLLSSYLSAGGKLWLGGRMTVGAMIADATGNRGDMVYPKGGVGGRPELKEGDFAYDFMKLHSTKIDNDKSLDTHGKNNLVLVRPWPGKPVIYEQMHFDPSKMNAVAARRGISHADAVFDPMFAHSEPGFRGLIDSLYAYGSTGLNHLDPPRSSSYENRLVGLRWHDPDPARQHGRIQWFGFPMYYLMDSDVQETFDRSLDWFQQEQPNTP
jgi:hypothetical protein